jgi:hypothetical protein
VAPAVRLCLRLFLVFAAVMTLMLFPGFALIEGPGGDPPIEVLREAALDGAVFAAWMTLLIGGAHVYSVRRLLGRWPTDRELRPAHTCAVDLTGGPADAARMVRAAVATLPGGCVDDEDPQDGWMHLHVSGGLRSWGTHVEVLLVPVGDAHTAVVISARPSLRLTVADYGASIIAAERIAERLREHGPRPLRASA